MATVRVFNHHVHASFYWLALVDMLAFILAFYAGTYLYFFYEPGSFDNQLSQIPARATLFAAVTVISLYAMGLYEPRMREGASGVLLRTVGGFVAATMVMSVIFYALPELHLWRGIYFYTLLVALSSSSRAGFWFMAPATPLAPSPAPCAARLIARGSLSWALCAPVGKIPA